eukprot:gnl/TRDRNA2_/TRDRNA2_157159_c0_seq2.p1 gnl/TRDRNA2_/TRDRNA2_157159_c0~~gnl/TRDRNA2_/TRDRNA2_157159_c0_seq2.p1  ORF type:complete len:613 (-),score=73.29 gnl/TRDRNA2_/TRDRNA2_157159_c0_seq2:6-1844(-)
MVRAKPLLLLNLGLVLAVRPGINERVEIQVNEQSDTRSLHEVSNEGVGEILCSQFKPRDVREQCTGSTRMVKIGKLMDRGACARACKSMASEAGQSVCCVFSDLDTCMAYPEGVIEDGSVKHQKVKGVVPYRGSATICSPMTDVDPHDQHAWLFDRKDGHMGESRHGEALFRTIQPMEIMQGGLGDCWLMAVIAAMSRFPGAVPKIFLQHFRSLNGEYSIQLYDAEADKWVFVSVDDSVPTNKLSHREIYAKLSQSNAIWVLLLEKAVAKFAQTYFQRGDERSGRGYSNLEGGWPVAAMTILTGDLNVRQYRFKQNSRYAVYRVSAVTGKGYALGLGFNVDEDGIWKAMEDGTRENRLMAATIFKKDKANHESRQESGLYDGHAYSVLQVRELNANKPAQVCVEEITVYYPTQEDWQADFARMEQPWWDADGPKRYRAGEWSASRAARYGVADGWWLQSKLVGTSIKVPGRVVFEGIVDSMLCAQPGLVEGLLRWTGMAGLSWTGMAGSGSARPRHFMEFSAHSLKGTVRLVQVRNPWGTEQMFNGEWSDGDRKTWLQHVDVAKILGFTPRADGTWWMTFKDFVREYDGLEIGGVNMMEFAPPRPNSADADA